MNTTATYFLSTGRCGTQWLAVALEKAMGDRAIVLHEPFSNDDNPANIRYHLNPENLNELKEKDGFKKHISNVKLCLTNKDYIETGWPSFVTAPLLLKEFSPGIKFVHIIRNPVEVALSLCTHSFYNRNDWIETAALTPFDKGVADDSLCDIWDELNAYEKCLFQWTEVNLYILNFLKKVSPKNHIQIKYENLFSNKKTLNKISNFIGAPNLKVPEKTIKRDTMIDQWSGKTDFFEWKDIFKHERTVKLAEKLGYDLSTIDEQKIKHRYFNEVKDG